MTPARMRRLASDYEEVRKNFAGHKNIIVTPIGDELPEKYHVTYLVNGIYLLPDGTIETLGRHEAEIILHADYPRYKPVCKLLTPIWHPNFRDGQICIGDIWGAGESLSDIIINIGDMIQYKSWNAFSPLSAEAAQWTMDNKHLFPVGDVDLFYSDYASAKDTVEIDLFDEDGNPEPSDPPETGKKHDYSAFGDLAAPEEESRNDFEITADELKDINFIPMVQRMQTIDHGDNGDIKINFSTVLFKGVLWALIGSLLGFVIGELFPGLTNERTAARLLGYTHLVKYYDCVYKADEEWEPVYEEFVKFCASRDREPDSSSFFEKWIMSEYISDDAAKHLSDYFKYNKDADDELDNALKFDFGDDERALLTGRRLVLQVSMGMWSALIAMFIGLSMGVGEGVFYGSAGKALRYGLVGAAISLVLGYTGGHVGQWLYLRLASSDPSLFMSSLTRAIGWSVMGVGIGIAIGLIKADEKRVLFCAVGGLVGAYLGGFLFNYICELVTEAMVARACSIVLMGGLIGVGVGVLEQFAKQAWLKVIRGEFQGKEYLLFDGTTSIGNNSKNTIVLFKDKLVGPHHCDIVLENGRYYVVDCGTPMGTIVNGRKVSRQLLRRGDALAIGNSVLVFNSK